SVIRAWGVPVSRASDTEENSSSPTTASGLHSSIAFLILALVGPYILQYSKYHLTAFLISPSSTRGTGALTRSFASKPYPRSKAEAGPPVANLTSVPEDERISPTAAALL